MGGSQTKFALPNSKNGEDEDSAASKDINIDIPNLKNCLIAIPQYEKPEMALGDLDRCFSKFVNGNNERPAYNITDDTAFFKTTNFEKLKNCLANTAPGTPEDPVPKPMIKCISKNITDTDGNKVKWVEPKDPDEFNNIEKFESSVPSVPSGKNLLEQHKIIVFAIIVIVLCLIFKKK